MHFKMINFVFCDFYLNFLKKMKCGPAILFTFAAKIFIFQGNYKGKI